MRFNDHLSPLKKPIKKYIIHSFDIETHGYKNKPVLYGYYDEKYHSFMNAKDFYKHIRGIKDKNIIIVATNLGFDFFGSFYDDILELKPIMRQSHLISAKHLNKKFVDTINYAPFGVKELGKVIGIKKLYNKFAKNGHIPKSQNQWRNYKLYNSRDCIISKKFMEYFQKVINDLGAEMKMTIASTAINLYRRKYLEKTIYKEKNFETIKDMIYLAYYGGRTEAFKRGRIRQYKNVKHSHKLKEWYYYDFTSLYPSCMIGKYPLPSSARYISSRKGNISLEMLEYEGISEVRIHCPNMKYPLLPYRHEGKLIFPIGEIRGCYTHIELRKALELGYKIKKIYRTIYYKKTFYPFKRYVEDLYKKKSEAENPVERTVYKLLLNSLYGKFATKNMQEITIKDFNKLPFEENYFIDNNMKGYKTEEKEADNNYVIPILACYTTAYGRIKLYDAIRELEPIYCDTDSCLTERYITPSEALGDLKLEKVVIDGIIVKPKLYKLVDKDNKVLIRAKGFKNMDLKAFDRLMDKKPIRQKQFTKFKESLKRRYSINQRVIFDKYADLEDNKRLWNDVFNPETLEDSIPVNVSCDDNNL